MIYEFRNIYFRHVLNSNGTLNAENVFLARSNCTNAADARRDAVLWAGEIGKNMKVAAGKNKIGEHPDFLLDAFEIKETEHDFVFEIKLHGAPPQNSWTLLPGSKNIEEKDSIIRKSEYSFRGVTPPSIPHYGDTIADEDGKIFFCTASIIEDCGNQNFKLALTYEFYKNQQENSVENSLISIKNFYKNQTFYRQAVFFWSNETYNSKLAELRFYDLTYHPDWANDNFVLEKMECDDENNFGKIVTLTAAEIENKLISVEQSENNNGKNAVAVYRIKKSDCDDFKNLLGTTPVFINGDFIINSVNIKDLNPAVSEVQINAVEITDNIQLGAVSAEKSEHGIGIKTADFFVPSADIDTFRSTLSTGIAAEWAGNNYYLDSFSETPHSNGSIFKLKAREIYTRMLSFEQKEKFNGFTAGGNRCCAVYYQSIWQVSAGNIDDFKNLTGQSADWCSDDNIITEITPEAVSPIEYMVKIEAQRRSNPDLHQFYNNDNYVFLGTRKDLDCKMTDFYFTAEDCGYHMLSDGSYDLLPDWNYILLCPLITTECLPISMVNNSIKIIRICETVYKRGSMSHNIDDMIEWSKSRIFNGTVGGHYGSYLKNDIYGKEIYDNHGFEWSKITRIYDLAPEGRQWNPDYYKHL